MNSGSASSMSIHPTAIVDPSAKVHPSCKIGPYCTIGANVELGEACELISHVAVEGPTKIGARNQFFPFSSIGLAPQDITYNGEPTRLEIGDHNVIREFVTINRGTAKGGGLTKIGSHNLIMAYTHIAHDCAIGDHVIMANAATLGGHVIVEDWATVGALCPVHHFVRIGSPRIHRRGDHRHPRRSAVFQNRRRARHSRLRIERRRARAPRLQQRPHPQNPSRVQTPAGVKAEHLTGSGKIEIRAGSRGRCRDADQIY